MRIIVRDRDCGMDAWNLVILYEGVERRVVVHFFHDLAGVNDFPRSDGQRRKYLHRLT
jgi:hypothetical protein